MINVNQCRFNCEGTKLIIEATIDNLDYYKDVEIQSVVIDTDINYSDNGPQGTPITFDNEFLEGSSILKEQVLTDDNTENLTSVYDSNKDTFKHVKLILNPKDINVDDFNKNIFYVYIIATTNVDSSTPCGFDNNIAMIPIFNGQLIYKNAINFVKELNSNCSISENFIDFILQYKALELALKTGNCIEANNIWQKYFNNTKAFNIITKCNCNGTV